MKHHLTTGPTGSGKTQSLHDDTTSHFCSGGTTWLCTTNEVEVVSFPANVVGVGTHSATTMFPRVLGLMEDRMHSTDKHTPLLLALDEIPALLTRTTTPQLGYILAHGAKLGIRIHATAQQTNGLPSRIRSCFHDATHLTERITS